MNKIKKNAFTLIELVIVVTIMGILIMATTIYLGGTDDKRKIIEAQGCANTVGGELNNFIFYTLTSKNLQIDNNPVSPEKYIIQLTGCDGSGFCEEINLSYSTGDNSINLYKNISSSKICHQTKLKLLFYRSGGEDKFIMMNKGFSPTNEANKNVFYISGSSTELTGDIKTTACFDKDCSNKKEIGKFGVDARSQTISRKKCKFYDEDPTQCKEREN